MKKITSLLIAATLLNSCESKNTESKDEKQEHKPSAETTVSPEPDVIVEVDKTPEPVVEEEVFDYSKIEHYAVFDTKSRLYENFGAENIVDGSSWFAEGTVEMKHSILTNPNNFNIIKYIWDEDNETLSMIEANAHSYNAEYEITGNQVISSESGIYTGMTLKELKEWNGADVEFYGFGWDFGGGIVRKEGSKISQSGISFNLEMEFKDNQEQYNKYSGDISLSTSDAELLEAPIYVNQITLMMDSE